SGSPGATWYCSFFFSSRRRHTRFSRDWSSDVCSSDLLALDQRNVHEITGCRRADGALSIGEADRAVGLPCEYKNRLDGATGEFRSEERRVGKECRSRWRRGP